MCQYGMPNKNNYSPQKRHYCLNRNKNYKYLRGDLSQIVFQKVYYDMPLKYAIEFLMRYM